MIYDNICDMLVHNSMNQLINSMKEWGLMGYLQFSKHFVKPLNFYHNLKNLNFVNVTARPFGCNLQ